MVLVTVQDVSEIIKGLRVGSTVDCIHEFDHLIWMGDLNYRLTFGDQTQRSPSEKVRQSRESKTAHPL